MKVATSWRTRRIKRNPGVLSRYYDDLDELMKLNGESVWFCLLGFSILRKNVLIRAANYRAPKVHKLLGNGFKQKIFLY